MAEVSRETVLMICAKGLVDARTVGKYLRGEKVRAISAERIERAARELGIELKAVAA